MSESSSTTIAVVSDTHYWVRNQPVVNADGSIQLQKWSEELLDVLLAELVEADVDLVLHLGDLTCGGGSFQMPPDDFAQTMSYMHRRFSELPMPVVALPGNHDVRPGVGDLQDFYRLWHYEAGLGKTIDLPQARLILLNSMGHSSEQIAAAPEGDPVYGWVSDAEIARLDTALATAAGTPVLIFTHQLLERWSGEQPWQDYFGILNAPDVLDVIARRGGVSAVLQGHAHRLDIQEHRIDSDRVAVFGVVPAIIEFPVAWVRLNLTADQGHCQLQRLPLAEIAAISERSGSGQTWRQGKPAWWDYRFALC